MSVNQRLKSFLDAKNILQKSLIERGLVTRGTIINYVKEGKPIRHDFLEELKSAYPELNMNWLFTGEGDMELKEESELEVRLAELEADHIKDNIAMNKKLDELHGYIRKLMGDKGVGR